MSSLDMREAFPADPDTVFALAVTTIQRWRFCRIEGNDESRRVISFNVWLSWRSFLSPFLQGSPDMMVAVEPAEGEGSLVFLPASRIDPPSRPRSNDGRHNP
jgi:hypothetical protein